MKNIFPSIVMQSLIASTLIVPALGASNLEAQIQALRMIRETAADICQRVEIEGHSRTTELTGDAKAKLSGVVAKIADLGIDGAVKYNSTEYRNVLQQDLSKALQGAQDCRLTVFKTLQEKMLGPAQ